MLCTMKFVFTKQEHKKYQGLLLAANTLRNKQTAYEEKLWHRIKRKQLCNIQFYRQKILLNHYIVDFYAPKIKLAIEIDGIQHFLEEHIIMDKMRDEKLNFLNITVRRYSNIMINKNIEYVMSDLCHCINNLLMK